MYAMLAIDQGASKTQAAVCDTSGRILGVGRGPGGYHLTTGLDAAVAAINTAAYAALADAQLGPEQLDLLFGGLTGADWPDEYELLRNALHELRLAPRVAVVNDSIVALRGGTSAPYGAILIAGSGGNCALRAPDGTTFIYHFYHDDELQGGTALGRRALRAIYRAATDREPPTALTALALERLALPDVDALLRADCEGRLAPQQIAGLAPLIFEAACADDEVAAAIIRSFGVGLAELVAAGARRLAMAELPFELVLSGSVFKGPGRLLQTTIAAALAPTTPHARLVDARYEPVVGALLLGLEALGRDTPATRAAIENDAERRGLLRVLRP